MKFKIIQTCDGISDYLSLYNISSQVNKAYCDKWDYTYESFIGLKRGYHPWHAVFNRIYMLEECIEKDEYDWIVYLDVDAYISNFELSFDDIVCGVDTIDKAIVLMGFGKKGNNMCINSGVLFVNLKHSHTKSLIQNWKHMFELVVSDDMLKSSLKPWSIILNNVIIDDQVILSMMFFLLDELKITDTIVKRCTEKTDILNNDFIQQVMRPNKGIDGTFVSYRVQLMKANVLNIIRKTNIDMNIKFDEDNV